MTTDNETVPVIFRTDRSGDFKGHVTAVFPTLPADYLGALMICYAHVGQHSGCSFVWYRQTRRATPAEYAALKKELESEPYCYQLKVYQRIQPAHRDALRKAVEDQK